MTIVRLHHVIQAIPGFESAESAYEPEISLKSSIISYADLHPPSLRADPDQIDDLQKGIYFAHAQDLSDIQASIPQGFRALLFEWLIHNDAAVFLKSVIKLLISLARTILASPFALVLNPVGFIYHIVAYVAIFFGIAVFQNILLWSSLLGASVVMGYLSSNLTGTKKLSFINWGAPEMFDSVITVRKGAKVFSKSIDKLKKEPKEDLSSAKKYEKLIAPKYKRVFNLDAARSCLLFSAALYERSDEFMHEASKAAPHNLARARKLIQAADDKIISLAQEWGVKYVGITTCQSSTGATIGAFYSDPERLEEGETPWIVLVCRGTGPGNFEQWVQDVTCTTEASADWLWGSCHQGFYNTLFPAPPFSQSHMKPSLRLLDSFLPRWYAQLRPLFQSSSDAEVNASVIPTQDRSSPPSPMLGREPRESASNHHRYSNPPQTPFIRVRSTLTLLSKELKTRCSFNEKINVFVAGHSLGGGLASLLWARLLKESTSKEYGPTGFSYGTDYELRDAFVFGCPNVGGSEFLAGFEQIMHDPVNQHRNFWRISQKKDFVASIPPGLAGKRSVRNWIRPESLLNYGAMGTEIVLQPQNYQAPFFEVLSRTKPGDHVVVEEDHIANHETKADILFGRRKSAMHPISLLNSIARVAIPFIIYHSPPAYWTGLAKMTGKGTRLKMGKYDDVKPKNKNATPEGGGVSHATSAISDTLAGQDL